MGLGDLMYHAGIRYGSEDGQEFAAQVMEFVRYTCMQTSVELAQGRGAFPAIQGSIYDPQALLWQPPQPAQAYRHDWDRPRLDWHVLRQAIRQHGIRMRLKPPWRPPAPLLPWLAVKAMAANRCSPWLMSAMSMTTAKTCS